MTLTKIVSGSLILLEIFAEEKCTMPGGLFLITDGTRDVLPNKE